MTKPKKAAVGQVAPVKSTAGKKPARSHTKLAMLEKLLRRPQGATIAQLCKALSWQQHSIRGAMAGPLKMRELAVTSEKTDGTRIHRIAG